jgi:hypothetical protein
MKDIISKIYDGEGSMTYQGHELDLPFILAGIHLLRQGAFQTSFGHLAMVKQWTRDAVSLVKSSIPLEILVNAAAEDLYGAFEGCRREGLGFLWGAVLGDHCGDIYDYYLHSTVFSTRVVGLKYDGRLRNLEYISKGQPVALTWEPDNPYDPNAIQVVSSRGEDLGYLRRTISKQVAQRLRRGEVFAGSVATILGEEYPVNERLYIRVKQGVSKDYVASI